MKISLGADEKLPIVDKILSFLKESKFEVLWHGPNSNETISWVKVAKLVAEDITAGRADEGILLCWTGTGVCMAANKVNGIRAALCVDPQTARGARLWNDANILCLSMRLTSSPLATEILSIWFETSYQPNPGDDESLSLLKQLETANLDMLG